MKVKTALRIMEKIFKLSKRCSVFQVFRLILGPAFSHMFGEEYDHKHIELYERFIKEDFREFLGDINGKVLEIGCGVGILTRELDGMGLDIVRYPQWDGGDFILGDACNLPFKDRSFDIVVLSNLLEHVEKPKKAIIEAKRVCKNKIYVSFPTKYSLSALYHYLAIGKYPLYNGLDYKTIKMFFLPDFIVVKERERILPFNPRNNFSNPEMILQRKVF